jgi:S-adenosylmethionine hydrolase
VFLQAGGRATATVHVGAARIAGLVDTYADAGTGALCALFGSADRLEIAISGGSAAERIGAGRGAAVRVDVS